MQDTILNKDRPAQRTALIAQELARYRIDIVAPSVTRLPGESSITDDQGGYTFIRKDTHQMSEDFTVLDLR